MTHKEQLYSTYTTKKPGKNEKELTSLFSTSVAKYNSPSPCERTAGMVEWALPACIPHQQMGLGGLDTFAPQEAALICSKRGENAFFYILFIFIAVVKNNTIL